MFAIKKRYRNVKNPFNNVIKELQGLSRLNNTIQEYFQTTTNFPSTATPP